ncbi:MAG: hypothetical protein JNK70_13860, partial [Phycisphaerae bacterium]|nr:hypothetical protein [Phycisphaerae bacterium]
MSTPAPVTRQHFNAARLRAYTWNQLKLEVTSLDEGRGKAAAAGAVTALLEELVVLEQYWAYPGIVRVRQLRALAAAGQWHALHVAVDQIGRALVSGAFRNDPLRTIADPVG